MTKIYILDHYSRKFLRTYIVFGASDGHVKRKLRDKLGLKRKDWFNWDNEGNYHTITHRRTSETFVLRIDDRYEGIEAISLKGDSDEIERDGHN